jgi:hypothetical protein
MIAARRACRKGPADVVAYSIRGAVPEQIPRIRGDISGEYTSNVTNPLGDSQQCPNSA